VDSTVVRSLLILVFAAMALFYGFRLVTSRTGCHRVSQALRVAMCVAMVVMLGPWTMALPTQFGVSLFLAATFWFVYLALFGGPGGGHPHPWFDMTKMLAMAWMYVTMSPAATRPPTSAAASMPTMAGMGSSPTNDVGAPTWSAAMSVVVGALLLLGAAWQLRRPVGHHYFPPDEDIVAASMAAAMAASLFLVL